MPPARDDLVLLPQVAQLAKDGPDVEPEKVKAHRVDLGPLGYAEGDDDEVIGIVAQAIAAAEEPIGTQHEGVTDGLGTGAVARRATCRLSLGRCDGSRGGD